MPTYPYDDPARAIRMIPDDQISPEARDKLLALVRAGHEVTVYHPHMRPDVTMIWVRPAMPWIDGRYTAQEWSAHVAAEENARQGGAA